MFQEYPKWVYPDGDATKGVKVASAEEEAALAPAPVDEVAADDAATAAAEEVVHTVESLRAALDAKGTAYDNRWGVKRLQQALSE